MRTSKDQAVLLTLLLPCASVSRTNLRHYRKVAQTVIRYYAELEDGVFQTEDGPRFDARLLDYRIDVDKVLKKFDPREVQAIMCIVRDGLTHGQAVKLAGIPTTRPDHIVEDIEIRMGQAFERLRLDEFLRYVDYLR